MCYNFFDYTKIIQDFPKILRKAPERNFMFSYKSAFQGKNLLPPVFTGSTLKLFALIFMLIDHIGAVILEHGVILSYNRQLPYALSYSASLSVSQIDQVLRGIGRLAFPIFCFLLVEGFFHTSNRKKYTFRLFLFALISEIPFDLAFNSSLLEFTYQNVMFTLLFGLLTIWGMEKARFVRPLLAILPAAAGIFIGWLFQADYDWRGIILIIVLYVFYQYPVEKTIIGCLCLLWEPLACLAFIPLNMYNHQKGQGMKYLFYLFYPVHLLILFCIRYALFRI